MTDVSPLSVGMNPYPIPTQEAANVFLLTFNFLAISALLVPASSIALIFSSFPVSFIFRVMSSHGTSQLLSGGDSACKSLTGTLGNQVAFYLCGKGKSECQYLRLYIISQLIFLFHREQDDIFSTYMHSVYSLLPSIFFPNERSPTQSMYPLSLFFSIVRQAFCLWLTVFLKPFLPPTHQFGNPSVWQNDLSRTAGSLKVCLSVETRIYAYIIAASLSFLLNKERQSNLYYQRRKVSPDLIEVF